MLELLSEKSGPLIFLPVQDGTGSGNPELENADRTISMRAIVQSDFQVLRCAMRFMEDERIIFSNPEASYVLLFVFNYSLQLQLPSAMKIDLHDGAAQLIFLPRGRFTLEFQRDRAYLLLLFFYTDGFIRDLEEKTGPFWPRNKPGTPALYFSRSMICPKSMMTTVSTQLEAHGNFGDTEEFSGAVVLSALLDFINNKTRRFQPAHLLSTQLNGFYAERDRLLTLATRVVPFSRMLVLADIRDRPLFRKRMNQLYGINIRDFIMETRMEKAKELLADFALPIKQIAGLTGFKNPFYFSRVFSRYCGKSPKSFRSGLSA